MTFPQAVSRVLLHQVGSSYLEVFLEVCVPKKNRNPLIKKFLDESIVIRNGKIVWRHRPKWPFYALMVRNNLYQNPFFPTVHQNVNKSKSRAARAVYGPKFLTFHKIIVGFFSFFLSRCKTGSKCAIIGCKFSNQHCIKHRAESQTMQIISFSLMFPYARSYLHKKLGTAIKILQSWLVGWCIYCVTLRLHTIKKLQSPLNTP